MSWLKASIQLLLLILSAVIYIEFYTVDKVLLEHTISLNFGSGQLVLKGLVWRLSAYKVRKNFND